MPRHGDTEEPLVAAARALEGELGRYVTLTDEVRRIAINSEKSLARASRAIKEAADCHERILQRVGALSEAMVQTRERQERCLEQMAAAAGKVSERATAFRTLLARYEALSEQSKSLNELATQVATLRAAGADPAEVMQSMDALLTGTGVLVTRASELAAAAKADDFDDLARSVDALKQQMQAARNKLALAHKTLVEQRPS